MQYSFDIHGNLLQVIDPKNRNAFTYEYDLLNRNLVTTHLDAGRKILVPDALSRPTEARDAKGALVLSAYDALSRPVKSWARDFEGEDEYTSLRTKTIYGDSSDLSDPEQYNLLGKPYKVFDGAGLSQIDEYDFRGLPPAKKRQLIKDDKLKEVFDSGWDIRPFVVDWDEMFPIEYLDPIIYLTSMQYDALGRVTKMLYPEDVDGQRKILLPVYNKAGALTAVNLKDTDVSDPVNYVQRIAYNAKGQRILVAYGNEVMSRYRYDETTFRLQRMRSEGYTIEEDGDTITYEYGGTVKQNMFYTTDLVGNIVETVDYTTGCGIAGADEMQREFDYDPLYRLLSATGRETAATAILPWDDLYRPENPTLSRGYTQSYTYDKVGNIQELQHVATGGNFMG